MHVYVCISIHRFLFYSQQPPPVITREIQESLKAAHARIGEGREKEADILALHTVSNFRALVRIYLYACTPTYDSRMHTDSTHLRRE